MSELTPLIGSAEAFPVLRHWDFFNHAGVAPITQAAADAFKKYANESESGAYLATSWYADVERLRLLAASMIHAHRNEIAFVKNTSEGLSIVASGLDWQWGDRIVTTAVEYPANIYPWMEVVRSHGCNLVMVAEETDPATGARHVPLEKILEAASHPKTRLVTISHVEYASGQRHDIAKIGAFCRERNILFCVDAIQSLGALPLDVKAMGIDYLACGGQKWLLGPEGAAFFYCRRDLIEPMPPLDVGASSVVNHLAYGDYDYTLKNDALRFESGSTNIAGMFGLLAAMEFLHSLGADAISQRIKHLTDRLIEGVRDKGYSVISLRRENQWSGIVCFTSPNHDHSAIVRALRKDHNTEIVVREGRLRVSPHFYNTDEQIDRLVDQLPSH